MDAIKNIITNVPDWVKRLDDLSGQIDQRQLELARLELAPANGLGRTKSVRNKGSTESLKPNNEAPAWGDQEGPDTERAPAAADGHVMAQEAVPASALAVPAAAAAAEEAQAALEHQTIQAMQAAQAKARATMRQRERRTNSIGSAEKSLSKYRTRSLIIVYYDSYVQSFFEELVKFVSASRNMMRKAKMAAKVAEIKRMADLEMPDADDSKNRVPRTNPAVKTNGPFVALAPGIIEAADPSTEDDDFIPQLNYISTRQMRGPAGSRGLYARAGRKSLAGKSAMGSPQQPDVYDALDKELEVVQSTCEHAAHQFLRDGDCSEEIERVKRRLTETRAIADREMERVKKEDPEALNRVEPTKSRSFRPQHMRKELPAKESTPTAAVDMGMALEVDEGIEVDYETPKLVYKPAAELT